MILDRFSGKLKEHLGGDSNDSDNQYQSEGDVE